jgi:archaellum component FlaC|tara:strand:- start:187 stop:447 length:261 start_codon:yes stop_codon:yes gene_type:complete
MELLVNAELLWNILLTLIIAPLGFLVRQYISEVKRLDILLNKTREEVAREYVTRDQIEKEFQRIMEVIDRIDGKIDRLQTKTYFQD